MFKALAVALITTASLAHPSYAQKHADYSMQKYMMPPPDGVYHCRSLAGAVIDLDEDKFNAEASPGQMGEMTIRIGLDDVGRFAEISGVNQFNLFPTLRARSAQENEFVNPPSDGMSRLWGVALKLYQNGFGWLHIATQNRAISQSIHCSVV